MTCRFSTQRGVVLRPAVHGREGGDGLAQPRQEAQEAGHQEGTNASVQVRHCCRVLARFLRQAILQGRPV